MPIFFSCPHCGLKTNVADEFAGQSGPCTRCGQIVVVPESAGAKQRAAPWAASAVQASAPATRSRWRRATPWIVLLLLAVCCGGPLYVMVIEPVASAYREHGQRTACAVRMQQIGQALLAYHQQYQSFPPPYLTDASGAPAHSWRVLLLPYLGEQELYAQYVFSEPWDGPANNLLAKRMPEVYGCTSDPAAGTGLTAYVAVVGSGFVFDPAKTVKLAEITDLPSDTVLFVECAGLGIHWMEPRDLEDGKVEYTVNETAASVLQSHHREGAFACLADASPEYFDDGTPIEDVESRFTVGAGD